MRKKQFKTESKKMLDMMINSIYTHKEIFLRELISNASDAVDKRYFRSLTQPETGLERSQYAITLEVDADARTLTVTDNGCGMSPEELENNLGTIARSGSFDFKNTNGKTEEVDIIGQFGVGFYSSFMVSDRITVRSRTYGAETGYCWQSEGVEGYTLKPCDYDAVGTEIVLHIKPDTDTEQYGEFLEEYRLRSLVKKYSDYIRYPIKMEVEKRHPVHKEDADPNAAPEFEACREVETLNSMVPIWHRDQKDVSAEEYETFYREKYFDYEAPARVIRTKSEGTVSFESLLFIPKHPSFDYYTKNFEKGLQLYCNGVMIMEKCPDLLPDHFAFVRGLVDSEDFTLNISRETLQHDHQLRIIAKAIDKKIRSELEKMLGADRETYEAFFKEFGLQLKYGAYADFGANKDALKDLLLFISSAEQKYVSLKEYRARMSEEQKEIYYACGESVTAVSMLPQTEAVKSRGFEVLYLTDDVDEFVLKVLGEYDGKAFKNVCDNDIDITTDDEKEALKKTNEDAKELLEFLKESIGEVSSVKFTNTLGEHPVCLSSEGGISTEMEKVLRRNPGTEGMAPKAETVLEINAGHPVAQALRDAFAADRDKAASYAKLLYSMARLINGLPIENPAELSNRVCELMK